MCGVGKLSLGQDLFKSLKSMQTLMVPYFLLTGTTFDTHSIRNNAPSADKSCSSGLNGLDPEQMHE